MPTCARAILQPDGSYLLGLDPSETNPSTCAYVVETGTESLLGSMAALTPDDAQTIAVAVAGLWAVAWVFRLIAQSMSTPERNEDA